MTTLSCWKVLEPDSYYRSFIEKRIRPDERDWQTARPITLKSGSITTAEGSATVRLGNTSLVCGIKAEIAVPDLRHPVQGFIVPNVDLYPCCSSIVKTGPPGEKAMAASQFLADIIKSSNIIDIKSLCIVPNKIVWCLYCDVACLDYDGNLCDGALLSLVAALANTKLPKIHFDAELDKIIVANKNTEHLQLLARPTSTTFTVYNAETFLLDPTYEDEKEGNGNVTIVFKDDNTLCATHKSGGQFITAEKIQELIAIAKDRSKELQLILNAAKKKNLDNKVKSVSKK